MLHLVNTDRTYDPETVAVMTAAFVFLDLGSQNFPRAWIKKSLNRLEGLNCPVFVSASK
jgi:hypothetical protein